MCPLHVAFCSTSNVVLKCNRCCRSDNRFSDHQLFRINVGVAGKLQRAEDSLRQLPRTGGTTHRIMDVNINAEKFFQRLERLQTHWTTHKSTSWGGSDAICIPLGSAAGKEMNYSKSSSMHLYLLGYEFPDSIMIITRNSFHFMATAKKCSYLENSLLGTSSSISGNSLY